MSGKGETMKGQFGFVDPGAIMGVVVAIIILAIGIFAFFTVGKEMMDQSLAIKGVSYPGAGSIQSSGDNATWYMLQNRSKNVSSVGNSVFNIIGIVLVIGAIMAIVGVVYQYVR